jgi:hypothetical protein
MGLVLHFTLDRSMKQQQQYRQGKGKHSSGHAEDIAIFMRFNHQMDVTFPSLFI